MDNNNIIIVISKEHPEQLTPTSHLSVQECLAPLKPKPRILETQRGRPSNPHYNNEAIDSPPSHHRHLRHRSSPRRPCFGHRLFGRMCCHGAGLPWGQSLARSLHLGYLKLLFGRLPRHLGNLQCPLCRGCHRANPMSTEFNEFCSLTGLRMDNAGLW